MNSNNNPSDTGLHRRPAAGLVLLLAAMFSACGGTEDETYVQPSDSGTEKTQATAAEISQASADDYDENVNGLITGPTLKGWIDDWAANRPAGITGKLVILQASAGESGYEFIKPKGNQVFTYLATEWTETRSNGVIETTTMVPSGRVMDTFLAKYDIDPAKDMIVCAQGTGGPGQAMRAGRCWYMFRYWGTPRENVAQLNGGNQWNGQNTSLDSTYFAASGRTPPMTGSASVRDLPQINFALQATLEDMMGVVPAQDANLLGDGVFIWDARGNNLPSSIVTTVDINGDPDNGGNVDEYNPDDDYDFKNGAATQGHTNGALLLSYLNILDPAAGFTFKPKTDIQAYLNGETDENGNGFVDSTLQGVGAGNAYREGDTVYTYCETTMRAMITGFASAAILGLPTRFYDGGMKEWHSMANVQDQNGNYLLPWDSRWRTDKAAWSMFRVAGDSAGVLPRNIVDPYAGSANAIITEDLAYKGIVTEGATSDSGGTDGVTSSGGGGVALPTNPCGG